MAKRFGYLLFLVPPLVLLAAAWLGRVTGHWDAATLLAPLVLFVVIPVVDLLLGQDRDNPADETQLRRDGFYTALLVACLPVQLAVLVCGAWLFMHAPFSVWGRIGWTVSVGLSSGVLAINTAHELIHRQNRFLRWTGGALLATVGYASFMVEHVLGHHVHVATPEDGSTAKRGENVYAFIARAFARNIAHGFRLEHAKRARRSESIFSSELVWAYLGTLVLAATLVLMAQHVMVLLFFAGQAAIAIALLEVINFVEHYGLVRERTVGGRAYETTTPKHSWNSNYLLTNLMLFQLQRHSDHHANAARPYQILRHMPESPQLPFGYATMVVLALIPPLYRAVMHPLLDARLPQMQRA